jgi:alanine-glyoxylate transaminase/serine-glyoxylate transaminase/serine-pyruvate transaminase
MVEAAAVPLQVPFRWLLGPGPSNVHPRVLQAMGAPPLGYLDPHWIAIMDHLARMLRALFRTRNPLTIAMPGTGTLGMETGIANLVEEGDVVVVGANGFFGERMAEIARRYGAVVAPVVGEWGKPLDPEAVEREMRKHPKVKVLAVVHAETSTGVLQPLEPLAALARRYESLFLVDAVTSLGGSPVEVDAWGIDCCFSASQKCLGCPPGLAPITVSPRGEEVIGKRSRPVRSFYVDLTLHHSYWGGQRLYHHTAPVNLLYALYEGLRLILEEGLEARWERHRRAARALWAGLEALGLRLLVPEPWRLPQLTTVLLPEGVDERGLRQALREEWGIEVGSGLGSLRGRVLRIGLMGMNASPSAVLTLLTALEALLPRLGFPVPAGAGVAAAARLLGAGA